MFGNAGREHMEQYGTTRGAVRQDRPQEPQALGEQPVLAVPGRVHARDRSWRAPMVYEPLTKLQCCPTSDGAGAAILASEDFVKKHGLQEQAVEIVGMAMTTDFPSTLRREELHQAGRLRHDAEGGARRSTSSRASGPENVRRDRAARLLLGQRADHLRGARPLRGGQGRRADRLRRRRPTAASGS